VNRRAQRIAMGVLGQAVDIDAVYFTLNDQAETMRHQDRSTTDLSTYLEFPDFGACLGCYANLLPVG
jgi:hypothetical protein